MRKIYDLSLTLSSELPLWPGDTPALFEKIRKIEEGDICNLTHLSMSAHTGTHVDAPCHFLAGKQKSVDELSLDILTGQAEVVEIPGYEHISAKKLMAANIAENTERLLIKTHNSENWRNNPTQFYEAYSAITADGAKYLVEKGIKLVGVDYLSVAPFDNLVPTHQVLLEAGIVIIEALNLYDVAEGHYTLYCLPLKIAYADGAPARVILIQD